MGKQSTNEASVGTDRAERARERRARDDQWVSAAAAGDAGAYRRLVDAWTPGAFDHALHRGADERTAAEVVVRAFSTLQNELTDQETSFGALVMGAIERDIPSRSRALGKAARGAKRAAERLTRGTDPTALGSDPSISSMCWDALDVLGDRARDVTDLHWRHHLASDEIAAATGESVFRVDDIIRKAPQGLGAALRTRLLWAGGKPDHDELGQDLKANNIRQFDTTAVRVIHGHLRTCPVCRSRSLIALPAIEIFAAIPLVAVPAELARRLAATTWTPMSGGAPVAPPLPDDTPPTRPAPSAPLEPRTEQTSEAARSGARDARTVAAGSASAAFLAAGAASASAVDAPPAPSPSPTSGRVDPASTGHGRPSPAAPTTAPLRTSPLPLQNRSNPAPAATPAPAPAPPEPVSPPSGGGPAHAPVASRAAERDRGRPRWLVPTCIGVAVLVVLGLVVVFTRGDGGETAIEAGPVETTTTSRPAPTSTTTTTTLPTTTTDSTIAPTTEAPLPTPAPTPGGGGGGGGGGGIPVPPPTTRPQTVVANVQYDMTPGTIKVDAAGGSSFTWNVTATGPVTVEVTGPGVSSGAQSGQQTVCAPASSCGEGTHYFSIVVKDENGRQVGAGTAKLIIRQ